jgi:UDP-GlcNAc3NAcA epimerase
MRMPEEQNRILTDHLSKLLFVPTSSAVENLKNEGMQNNVYQVGDVMYDATLHFKALANNKVSILNNLPVKPNDYILTTIHRAENTDNISRLKNIIESLNECEKQVLLPLHPRTKKYLLDYGLIFSDNVKVIEPVGYLDMICLEMYANKIVTDSGGVQKEAFFMKKPCITIRDETEWIETVYNGWNKIVGTDKNAIIDSIMNFVPQKEQEDIFGDGTAAKQILNIINSEIKR